MPTPTPDLSVDELLAQEPLVNGDIALAQAEIARRLETRLAAFIEAKNGANGWTSIIEKIPTPAFIGVAPLDLTKVKLNCVLVAASVSTTPQGIGAFKNIADVRIWSIEGRASTSEQVLNHFRRAQCIRAVLLPFLRGCVTPEGVEAWRLLEPTGYAILGERREFSGVAATFTLVQSPNSSLGI